MLTRSPFRSPPVTSFDIEVDMDELSTPVRPLDVRAAFDFDQTVANPDHPLLTAERELFGRAEPSYPRAAQCESVGSIAPMAMELPRSIVPRAPRTPNAAPLSIVTPGWTVADAEPAKPFMTPGRMVMMCGSLAVVAAIAAFGAARSADDAGGPVATSAASPRSMGITRNAAAPPPAEMPLPAAREVPRAEVVPMVIPADPSGADWKSRLVSKPAGDTTRKGH